MSSNTKTPAWIDSLIDSVAPHHLAEEIRGDLYELYLNDINRIGEKSARRKYIFNALGFLAKSFFWKNTNYNSTPSIMLKSYFKMASRSLLAHKDTSIINILGLVIGIASAIVILTIVHYEYSFDKFHTDSGNIYRVVRVSGEDMSEFRTGVSYPVPAALREEIPALKDLVATFYLGDATIDIPSASGGEVKKYHEDWGCAMVEPSFFSIFDFKDTGFKWIAGNPKNALVEPFSIVLTKTIAHKYFGHENVLGRVVRVRFQNDYDFKVTGIIEDLPANTDCPFTMLLSYSSMQTTLGEERLSNWFGVSDDHGAYVVVPPGYTKEEIEEQIAAVHAAHTPAELHKSRHYLLQPLADVHYDTRFGNYNRRTISKQALSGLSIVAVFLLLTASINYINLATAQSSTRAKEIGLRKVMGSNRNTLMLQFLVETFVVVLIASGIGLGLAQLFFGNVQVLLNFSLPHTNFTTPFVLWLFVALILTVTLFSGFYPALTISRFNPVTALKNKFSSKSMGGFSLRKVLVVVQFTVTQILVVGTFIVVSQIRFFQNSDMGFARDAIITMDVPVNDDNTRQVITDKLKEQAFVSDVSFSFTLPSGTSRRRNYRDIGKSDATAMSDYLVFEYQSVDPSYMDLYQIKLAAGRALTDLDTVGNILINETLLKNLQIGSPEEAIGKELKLSSGRKVTLVGIINDFYSNSLKENVDNVVMMVEPKNFRTMSIKLAAQKGVGSVQDAIQEVEKVWTAAFPDFIFDYQFFDENVKAFYAQEVKYAKLFQLFSLIFLLIGCLGLYGLIAFVVNRKGKEVAVRKVLGATLVNILVMFSKEYVRLILLSFIVAVPVAYYVVDDWLNNFAHHITLHWWLFLLPGLMVLFFAVLVVITKSLATANANPVDELKHE